MAKMKYQIIKTQTDVDKFEYTVHLCDDSEPTQPSSQLCRYYDLGLDVYMYEIFRGYIYYLASEKCEYSWKTQEEAEQFVQDHIKHLESWPTDPRNPDTWMKSKIVKEIQV